MWNYLISTAAVIIVVMAVIGVTNHLKENHQVHPSNSANPPDMHISYCTPNGLSVEALQFSDAQQKYIATNCAAYYLGAYQLTGWEPYIDTFSRYLKAFKLNVQDIDSDTWSGKDAGFFWSEMQGVGYVLVGIPEVERDIRLNLWSKAAEAYFMQCAELHQSAVPKNLLKLVSSVVGSH